MPQGREFELKFSVEPSVVPRIVSHPALARGATAEPRRSHLLSTYFDTANGALRRRNVSLRVRRAGPAAVQTLKRAGASPIDRDEWEFEGGDEPDVAWLRSTPLASLFAGDAVDGQLDRQFTVDIDRVVLPVAFRGTQIEGAIDRGAIFAADSSLPVCELELERKGGPRSGILRLGRQLARDLPLTLSFASKAERGFAVAEQSWGHPSKAIPLDLSSARRLPALFEAVMLGCLQALCGNAALIGGAEDGEAVHKTRIALRHIRAGLELFAPALRRRRLARLRREVKWMSDRLGAARDADVFAAMAGDHAASGSSELAAALAPGRSRAHARLEAALNSSRWRLLLVDLLAFSLRGVRRSRRADPAAPFARRRLRKLRRRLARRTRGLRSLGSEALHDLRKSAKMLRYDLDLVGDLPKLGVNRGTLRRDGVALHAIQETLGSLHDAEAFAMHLDESVLARGAPSEGCDRSEWSEIFGAAQSRGIAAKPSSQLKAAAKAAKHLRRTAL